MQTPQGKYLFGIVKIGEKGQIVIPKEARDVFGLKPGDQLLMLGDIKSGIALVDPASFGIFRLMDENGSPAAPDTEAAAPTSDPDKASGSAPDQKN